MISLWTTFLSVSVLAASARAAAPPPAVEEDDATRCVTTIIGFLGLEPQGKAVLKGAGDGAACEASVEFRYFESGISRKMDRELFIEVDAGMGGGSHPYSFLGDLEDLKTRSVSACSVEGDTLTLDYTTHEKFAWRKSHRLRGVFVRGDGRLVSARFQKKELVFLGGGFNEEASCSAAPVPAATPGRKVLSGQRLDAIRAALVREAGSFGP